MLVYCYLFMQLFKQCEGKQMLKKQKQLFEHNLINLQVIKCFTNALKLPTPQTMAKGNALVKEKR